MAFLDPTDTVERLYSLVPANWFPDLADAPNLEAVLSMLAAAYSNTDPNHPGRVQFLDYVKGQTRVATASDFWLDLIAADFFGPTVQRHTAESDQSFRRRIILNLLAPRGTRPALVANVGNLTGFAPKIIELRNTNDCGAYTTIRSDGSATWGGAAYNTSGAYGTMRMPYQLLIDVTRPFGEGIPNVNGYSMSGAGYATYPKPFGFVGGLRPQNSGNGEYVELSDIIGMVTDDDIYDTISRTMPAGTTAWTRITSPFIEQPPTGGGAMLDCNFYLDLSVLSSDAQNVPGSLGLIHMLITASGTISQGAIHGILRMPIQAKGFILAQPPVTWSGLWTMPSITAAGGILASISKLTLPLQFKSTSIFTAVSQPVLGNMLLPFVLGAVPNAQPLLGQSFIIGQSAPGVRGGASIPAVSSVCQIGSLAITETAHAIPSVVSTTAVGALTETGSSSTSLTLPSVVSAAGIGSLGPQKQALLGQNMTLPFVLGVAASVPTVSFTASGVESASAIGNLTSPIRATGVVSATAIASLAAVTDQPQVFSATRHTSTITLSNSGLTASQSGSGSQDPVVAVKSATNGKFYWEMTVSLTNPQQITAGIANTASAAVAGNFVGHDANSLGWRASNGDVVENNAAIGSWPVWTSTAVPSSNGSSSLIGSTSTSLTFSWPAVSEIVTVCFALDLDDGLIWSRVGGGPWNGIPGSAPAGLLTLGVTPIGSSTSSSATAISILGSTPLGSAIPGQSGGSTPTADPNSAPTAPTSVTASASGTTVALSWTASTGGIAIPASVLASAVSPACSLYQAGDSVTAAFASTSWQFIPPDGYTAW